MSADGFIDAEYQKAVEHHELIFIPALGKAIVVPSASLEETEAGLRLRSDTKIETQRSVQPPKRTPVLVPDEVLAQLKA